MKIYYYFLVLLAIISLTNCGEQPPFSGNIKNATDGDWASMVYLIQPRNFDGIASSYEGIVLDSVKVDAAGKFVFNKMPDAQESILLQIAVQKNGERFLNKLENEDLDGANYFPMVWENGKKITVSADANHFQKSFTIKNPSIENDAMLRLRDIRFASHEKHLAINGIDDHDESSIIKRAEALLDFQKPLMEFANECPELLPAMVAIRWVSIEGDYERVPEFIFSQCEKWRNFTPRHPFVIQLCEKGSRKILPVMKGEMIPDFPLPMLSGETIPLKELLSEKLTLLDLWASWCAPCRKENRDYLVPLWDKHQQAGFQIVGYALDAGERAWKAAIKKDGADRWLHASHLQGDDSPFFNKLNIKTIPANFLLDGSGTVVAKNLHGEDLVNFVEEYMSKLKK